MKRLIKSYASFTRPERNGLIGVCLLLATLVALRAAVTSESEQKLQLQQQRIVKAYREQNHIFLKTSPKRKHSETNQADISTPRAETVQSEKSVKSEILTRFDPNIVDSPTLRGFGLKSITISNLMKWRAKGKRFYRKEDLRPLYTLTTEEYNMLAPYIDIKRQQINLNHADSITLLKLRGIGPKLAHKILLRRNTIGPFTHINQLKELYHFPDGVFKKLVEELQPLSEPRIKRD